MHRYEILRVLRSIIAQCGKCLQSDFSDLTVSFGHCVDIGGLARTIDNHIAVSFEATYLGRTALEFIFAHELIHVVQKRLPHDPSSSSDLEREANTVAMQILDGQNSRVCLADHPERPAYYEEFGHYYTCFFLMLAAGVPVRDARIRAFFSQVPDEVIQFDATSATRDYHEPVPWTAASGALPVTKAVGWAAGIPRATPPGGFKYRSQTNAEILRRIAFVRIVDAKEDPESKRRRLQRDLSVTQGLHALTSKKGELETDFRVKALHANWSDLVISGLALHPLGDSFSHRSMKDRTVMYGPDTSWNEAAPGASFAASTEKVRIQVPGFPNLTFFDTKGPGPGHAGDGHEPDHPHLRPHIYLRNCKRVFEAIKFMTGCSVDFDRCVRPVLNRVMSGVGSQTADNHAEKLLTQRMRLMVRSCSGEYYLRYRPESEKGTYWSTFAQTHRSKLDKVGGEDLIRRKIEAAALTWLIRVPHVKPVTWQSL